MILPWNQRPADKRFRVSSRLILALLLWSGNAIAEPLPPAQRVSNAQTTECELASPRFRLEKEVFQEMVCAKAPSFLVDLDFQPFQSILKSVYLDAGDLQYKKIQRLYQLLDFTQDESKTLCPLYSAYLKEFKDTFIREYNLCKKGWSQNRVDLLCSEILRIHGRFMLSSVSDYWLRNYEQSVEVAKSKPPNEISSPQTAPPIETESTFSALGKWCDSAENLQLEYGPFGLPDCVSVDHFVKSLNNETAKSTLQSDSTKKQITRSSANPFPENLMFYSHPYLLKYCREPESRQTSKILNFHCRLIQ